MCQNPPIISADFLYGIDNKTESDKIIIKEIFFRG